MSPCRRRAILAVVLAIALGAPAIPARAQVAPPLPSGPLHRALGAPEWLSLRLEQRTRIEHLQNDFRTSSAGKDETAGVLRTLLAAEAHIQRLSVGVELEDSRAYAPRSTPRSSTPSRFCRRTSDGVRRTRFAQAISSRSPRAA